jgi:hypothetical protein
VRLSARSPLPRLNGEHQPRESIRRPIDFVMNFTYHEYGIRNAGEQTQSII